MTLKVVSDENKTKEEITNLENKVAKPQSPKNIAQKKLVRWKQNILVLLPGPKAIRRTDC